MEKNSGQKLMSTHHPLVVGTTMMGTIKAHARYLFISGMKGKIKWRK